MSDTATPDQRLAQFEVLYREVLNQDFSPEDFVADVLYAFTALETAARSQSQALRNLAAHLQIDLEMGIETINIRPLEPEAALTITRKMRTLAAQEEQRRQPADAEPPQPRAERRGEASGAERGNAPAAERRQPGTGERRQTTTVLTPEMAKMIERLLRFYGAEFGKTFDLEEFLSNDLYGRAVLKKAQDSSNPELLATAQYFLDEEGRPRRHRRRGSEADRRPPPP
ncbi:MAG TPA: hypothetical protein VH105_00415 [Burkholderiales bacterium]|jgi:hypothetical protein|nr:hypothetical protein [Burkholderiales bacterium]